LNSPVASRNIPERSTPAGLRFFGYALLALALMWLDQRGAWLHSARFLLQGLAYPLQMAVASPAAAWRSLRDAFETRIALQQENAALRERLRELELQALRRTELERENIELRNLRLAAVGLAERWLTARLIAEESSRLRQRYTVDRGAAHGVVKGQPVISAGGLVGQALRVGPWSTEVILIADPEHAVPVQVARTGQRTLALGTGRSGELTLPLLPLQTDIRAGDLLVTSGLGGVFPAGYPVATVSSVRRDGGSPLAQVQASTTARLDRDRVVAFLWLGSRVPAAPAPAPAASVAAAVEVAP